MNAIDQLRAAIENEGPQPRLHRDVMSASRRDWPTLWRAIDAVLSQDIAYGKADWIWDEELQVHIPCCTFRPEGQRMQRCGNGPLTGDEIVTGRCSEHPE